MVDIGDKIPDAVLKNAEGADVALASLSGAPFVLFFYPKADTPGCTTESIEFSGHLADFAALGYRIVGVSKDSPAKLGKFAAKHDLTVDLLSDEEGAFLEAMGVWVEKKNYGKTYMGIERTTFLVDAAGVVTHVWRKVRVKGHVAAVLAAAGG